MKLKIVFLIVLLVNLNQITFSFEGSGFNLGVGGYGYIMDKGYGLDETNVGVFYEVDFPLVESHTSELEFGFVRYYIHNNNELQLTGTPYYGIRFYMFDKTATIRPSANLGSCILPVVSWNFGAGIDYNFSENIVFQPSFRKYRGEIVQMASSKSGKQHSSFLFLSCKYYIR